MKAINRFWLFIYSTPNIVGSLLGLAGLLLFFAGLIKSYWFLIVAGLYLAGYIGCPRNEQISLKMKNDLQVDLIESELNKLVSRIRKRVLPEILTRVRNIADLVSELLPAVSGDPHNRHVLVQTATDYLPSMLEHYLNLPTTFARFHPLKNGKTPRQILEEQLILLEEQLQKMAQDIHAGDAEALLTHSRFLKKKFHRSDYWKL